MRVISAITEPTVASSAWASRLGHRLSSRRACLALLQAPGSKRLELQASTSHRRVTGLLVPEHRDERAPASAQPGPEGSAAHAIRLKSAHGERRARDEAAGALKSPRIPANSGALLPCYLAG
jgi:hypothetical protein